jgi:hypothetical protein
VDGGEVAVAVGAGDAVAGAEGVAAAGAEVANPQSPKSRRGEA